MKIDLHVHTSEVSACGQMSAHDTVKLYSEAGYGAIVITNHYNTDTAKHHERHGHPEFNKLYHDTYELAKKYGEEYGILVFCGYEIRFNENPNDYLVFGMPEDVRENYLELFAMRPREFGKLARERDFLFYQAHPFRNGMTVCSPDYLFGIESKNANPRHDARNDIASMWADKFSLHKIAGSDCHQSCDVGISGIETDERIESLEDLIEVLKNDRYKII